MIPFSIDSNWQIPLCFTLFICNGIQWVIVFYNVKQLNLFADISHTAAHRDAITKGGASVNVIPFKDDKFYTVWNMCPFLLVIVFMYISLNWKRWNGNLLLLLDNPTLTTSFATPFADNYRVLRLFTENIFVAVLLLGISIFAGWFQTNKQNSIEENNNVLYWWDRRISKSIFRARQFVLCTNMLAILSISYYCILLTILLIQSISQSIEYNTLDFLFFHIDGVGGLKVIEQVTVSLVIVFFILSTVLITGLIDHINQGRGHLLIDSFSLLIAMFAIVAVAFYPAYQINTFFDSKYEHLVATNAELIEELNGFAFEKSTRTEIVEWHMNNSAKVEMVQELSLLTNYQFIYGPLYYVGVSFLIPLILWLIPLIVDSYRKRRIF